MAKNKKNKDQKKQQKQAGSDEFTLKDYIYINIFFWAFLVVLAIVVYFTTGGKYDPVMSNVFKFIFFVFGFGFTAVSVFDYIYEKVKNRNEKA